MGLSNYWGYNSIAFFAPHSEYSAWGVEQVVSEFKYLVKTMHQAGIEVILDVVYNHTAEGNHLGPTLSFRGIDNPAYYRLADGGRYYFDTTGTGNTLNMRHPHVLQLIIDSLRYWVTEMHVDGFRFDLAASLARQFHEVDRLSAFFDLIQVDPVVSQVKLIAEPWDLGRGRLPGRQLPDPVVGVERPLPGHRPRLLARRRPDPGRLRLPADRQLRPLRADRAAPVRQRQLRHRARRVHPHRPGLLRLQAQRGQRRGEPRRHRRQPVVEQRRRGPDRRPGGAAAAEQPPPRADDDAAAEHGRADAPPRRRARPLPGRQQQRLLPGQRDLLARLGERGHRVRWTSAPSSSTSGTGTRSSGGAASSRASPSSAAGCPTSAGSGRTGRR